MTLSAVLADLLEDQSQTSVLLIGILLGVALVLFIQWWQGR